MVGRKKAFKIKLNGFGTLLAVIKGNKTKKR